MRSKGSSRRPHTKSGVVTAPRRQIFSNDARADIDTQQDSGSARESPSKILEQKEDSLELDKAGNHQTMQMISIETRAKT